MLTRLCVIGDAFQDVWLTAVAKRRSAEAPIDIYDVTTKRVQPGGAYNVVRAISLLDPNTVVLKWFTGSDFEMPIKTRIVVNGQQVCRFDMHDQCYKFKITNPEYITGKDVVISDYNKGSIDNAQAEKIAAAQNAILPAIRGALSAKPIKGRITVSGYEGSELLVARLLVESGADVPYVGTACPKTQWSDADRDWLEARGVAINYRASLEDDVAAVLHFKPDLAIGTTPVVQKAKELAIPSLYFTNLISARPLMGPAGAGSLAEVINAAIGNKARFDRMSEFFEGVGRGPNAGVWEDVPRDRPEFRAKYQAMLAARAKAEESTAT